MKMSNRKFEDLMISCFVLAIVITVLSSFYLDYSNTEKVCKDNFGKDNFASYNTRKIEKGYIECCYYEYNENHRGNETCEIINKEGKLK